MKRTTTSSLNETVYSHLRLSDLSEERLSVHTFDSRVRDLQSELRRDLQHVPAYLLSDTLREYLSSPCIAPALCEHKRSTRALSE